MNDYLLRDAAPLTEDEWEHLDEVAVATARQFLVGRRFLELAGPFGPGLETVPVGVGGDRKHIPVTVLKQDFTLFWRDIEANRRLEVPIEAGPAAQAAMACATEEDKMVLDGLAAAAKKNVALGDWADADVPLRDVVAATEALFADGFLGPYAVIVSPGLYVQTQRVNRGMGRMVGDLVKGVASGGVFRSALLKDGQGMVLSLGAYNFDLVVGQDLVTGYEGNEGLDHKFCVLETVALRVKRPGAICVFGA